MLICNLGTTKKAIIVTLGGSSLNWGVSHSVHYSIFFEMHYFVQTSHYSCNFFLGAVKTSFRINPLVKHHQAQSKWRPTRMGSGEFSKDLYRHPTETSVLKGSALGFFLFLSISLDLRLGAFLIGLHTNRKAHYL